MVSYNPASPCTAGLEWRPTRATAGVLDADSKAIGMILEAATTDVIDQFWAFLRTLSGKDGTLTLELFDLTASGGIVPQPPLNESVYYPSADLFVASAPWIPGTLGPHTSFVLGSASVYGAWKALNSTTLTPFGLPSGAIADNNEFVANLFGEGYDFAVQFDNVVGALAGRWVTRITSRALVAQYYDFDTPPGNMVRPYMWVGGRRYWGATETIVAAQGAKEVLFSWHVNPEDGLPWVPGVVDLFDPAGVGPVANGMGWVSYPTHSSNNITAILQAQLLVESSATDPRLAIGSTGSTRIGLPGWHSVNLLSPADASPTTVALTVGHRYLFSVRRTVGLAKIGLGRLEDPDGSLPGPPSWTSCQPPLDDTTRRILALGDESPRAYGAVLSGSGTVSLDSQPYATSSRLDGIDSFPALNEYFDDSPVHTGHELWQRFTAPATGDYGWLFILVAQVSEASDGDLAVQVRKVSDDSPVGSPFLITSTALDGPPRHTWQKIGVRNPGTIPHLVSGTQYYFDITSPATAPKGWLVQVLNALTGTTPPYGPPTGSSAATYGGGANRALVGDTLTPQSNMDVVVSISTIPATPSGLAAAATVQACCLTHINLVWDLVADPGCTGFESTEIQRRDTAASDWMTIARITDPNVVSMEDWESRRNTEASYRMRAIRADGVPSDWSGTVTATAPMTACTGLMFTSNFMPEATVFYQDLTQERVFQFPANYDEFEPHGRDGTIVFGELEDRFLRFKAKIRVRSGQGPCMPGCDDADGIGPDVFAPLRDLARASLPYVRVHDESGNSWYANVRVSSGTWGQHGLERDGGYAYYVADIEVIELTDVPSPIDAIAGS